MSQNTRNLLSGHVLVDEFGEDLPVVDIDAADVLLVGVYLIQKVAGNDDHDDDEEDDEDLQLVVFLLKVVRECDTDGEAAFAIWVSVLQEIVARLLIGHDRVRLGDLNELINSLGVVRVLVGMFFP